MELEVVRSPYEEALATFTALCEDHEIVPSHWYWMTIVRRWAPDARLFVYRHKLSGRFGLATWVFGPEETDRPVFMDLETFAADPSVGMWPEDLLTPSVMRLRLRPAHDSVNRIARKVAAQKAAKRAALVEDELHKQEACRYLRTHGKEREAQLLNDGRLPWIGRGRNSEGVAEMADSIRTMARVS